MKKLVGLFKQLPPELRMLVAMAGLGTPLGIFYAVQRFLFPTTPIRYLILGFAVVVGVICLVGFLLTKVFGGRSRKRVRSMEQELASSGQAGPTGMDVRAAIKENNEKFFAAIRDMRKNLGLSVYDLPWYIVLGDSGCGKTKLINEGGLVFSTGKPEGYQLGTLNYNWWFTEDAIFVDMAGRLCNPQEDADRREWTAFLETIGKGRKGYPVNGAIVCVAADHLLQDSPEKQEQDANTMLERLRDLQTRLGVTFATYLVVTKCDKILGFMPFFDRAGKDIAFKNQMFGWSKPGSYDELFDPEQFDRQLDDLYQRLSELRLRRLDDDVDEVEMGLAYSFPEEFRTLRDSLKIYVRTLFPMIKNPKAVKNLIFRGVYFTSATQEGEVVLKHLTQRLGDDTARQFPPLESLYPQPRPHFVKDLLTRKVLPENGLVFRNEQEVARNRKLARLLKTGSIAASVLLVAALVWSMMTFGKLINTPRVNAVDATVAFAGPLEAEGGQQAKPAGMQPAGALATAMNLSSGIESLRANKLAARVLSLNIGTDAPIRDLTRVETRLFEEGVLRAVLREVDKALRETRLEPPQKSEDAVKAAQAYRDALLVYVKWFGCAGTPEPQGEGLFEDFKTLCEVVSDKDSVVIAQRADFLKQSERYFKSIQDTSLDMARLNPARLLLDSGLDPKATIEAGVVTVHKFFEAYATLSEAHPDKTIAEWMRIGKICQQLDESYAAMLSAGREIVTQDDLVAFAEQFGKSFSVFDLAVKGIRWQGDRGRSQFVKIPTVREAILNQRKLWVGYEEALKKAYASCASAQQAAGPAALGWLSLGDQQGGMVRGLDRLLAESLHSDALLTDQSYFEQFFEPGTFERLIPEVHERYSYAIAMKKAGDAPKDDEIVPAADTVAVQEVLTKVSERLKALELGPPADLSKETLADWNARLYAHLEKMANLAKQAGPLPIKLEQPDKWRQEELAGLYREYESLGARGEGSLLLTTIARRLDQVRDWGLAELYPDWRGKASSAYQIAIPPEPSAPSVAPAPTPTEPREPERREIRVPGQPDRQIRRPGETERPAVVPSVAVELEGTIPTCTTPAFLNRLAGEFVSALIFVGQLQKTDYLPGSGEYADLQGVCKQRLSDACRAYIDRYAESWAVAYRSRTLTKLTRVQEQARDWKVLSDALGRTAVPGIPDTREVGKELESALAEILRAVPWARVGDDGRTWEQLAGSDAEWRDVADWFRLAVKKNWTDEGKVFVTEVQLPTSITVGPNDVPWEVVAREVGRRWVEVVEAVRANVPLPRQFDRHTKERREIPWGLMDQFRKECHLDDEKLTQRMVEFMAQGQAALSEELSQVLYELQQRYFEGARVYTGWPYVNPDGRLADATDTVDYSKFRQFLDETEQLLRVQRVLEEGLPADNPLKQRRTVFYDACQRWRDFLAVGTDSMPARLEMVVKYEDPLNPQAPGGVVQGIQDTPQYYYRSVHLALGLRIRQTGGAESDGPIEMPTVAQDPSQQTWEAIWPWVGRSGDAQLTMQFVGGLQRQGQSKASPNIPGLVLGRLSPLSFCAYLNRYGKKAGDNLWVTAHQIDLVEAFRAAGAPELVPQDDKRIMGVKFSFVLKRSLPDPIDPLAAGR